MASAYLVRADSSITRSADVDRAGTTVGAVEGQSQQIYVSENMKNARVQVMPVTPAHDALHAGRRQARRLCGQSPAHGGRRAHLADVRVLTDNFLLIGQAIVVEKGDRLRLDELNRFLADVRA